MKAKRVNKLINIAINSLGGGQIPGYATDYPVNLVYPAWLIPLACSCIRSIKRTLGAQGGIIQGEAIRSEHFENAPFS